MAHFPALDVGLTRRPRRRRAEGANISEARKKKKIYFYHRLINQKPGWHSANSSLKSTWPKWPNNQNKKKKGISIKEAPKSSTPDISIKVTRDRLAL
ncbi:hypothetical protein PUN28_009588 [Cardiocondyla obscurior]|uniref:Uncharacterized protein n=1 Tax=Cardiocondyla obscurior TaxID=286306 RepID=A0AAW2FXZ5_9HYME